MAHAWKTSSALWHTGLRNPGVPVPFQDSTQGYDLRFGLMTILAAGSRIVSLRLLYLIMIRVFDWLPPLGGSQSSFSWAIYRWIDDQPYADEPVDDEHEAAKDLARFVAELAG